MKNKLIILTLALQILAFSFSAKANEFSDMTDPSYSDESTTFEDIAANQLENRMIEEVQGAQVAVSRDESLIGENQALVETDVSSRPFALKDCNFSIIEKIAEETGEKSLSISKTSFKRSTGAKTFTYDQIKNVALNTKFTLSEMNVDKDNNKFTSVLKPVSGDFLIEVNGEYSASIAVPLLVNNISKGSQISQEDIELKMFPKNEIKDTDITEVAAIVGKTATKSLLKGTMVAQDSIRSAILITKNSTVSAIFRTDNIEVKALAVALDDGGEGDIIRLKNFDSGKTFKAVVQADGNVLIGTNNTDVNLLSNSNGQINNIN